MFLANIIGRLSAHPVTLRFLLPPFPIITTTESLLQPQLGFSLETEGNTSFQIQAKIPFGHERILA